jgi:hypothetical protein
MYITIEQIKQSLNQLGWINPFFGMSFLAFKKAGIPVGEMRRVNFTQIATDILNQHYHPSSTYQGFYNPFLTSKSRKESPWTKPRYPSTTLQRITTDTFSDVLIHPKHSSQWGWKKSYVEGLKNHLGGRLIPAFDLAVWLFRNEKWPTDATFETISGRLFNAYSIGSQEIKELFDTSIPETIRHWLGEKQVNERELLAAIGSPPGSLPEEGAALRSLELRAIGPATLFSYKPAERLNIITGDNSLGKTFLLECIWWALTGEWLERPVLPRTNVSKTTPRISFSVSTVGGRPQSFSSSYNWDQQNWTLPSKRAMVAGLVIYARFDGSFAVWDPARLYLVDQQSKVSTQAKPTARIFFSREDIWYGLQGEGRREWLCNGLLRDWVTWQRSGDRYKEQWNALVASLERLSPSSEVLEPGEPAKLPFNELEIPTIRAPYAEVPVVHASAGVQRAVALAYILVWAWFRHLENSSIIRRDPQRRLVLIVDEVEAHLHPKWQRVIVPAVMNTVSTLAPLVSPQIHLATHSPMVMASAETIFNEQIDNLHHLKLVKQDVVLDELPFVKRGRADLWLMSDVFGLEHARSLPAEEAIKDAVALQLENTASSEQVREVNSRLLIYLAQDDDFWPRWRFFAKQHGVDK